MMSVRTLALGLLLLTGTAPGQDQPGALPLTEDERIAQVLNRLTPGPTRELFAGVKASGLAAWLEVQLRGDLPEPRALEGKLAAFPSLGMNAREQHEKYFRPPAREATAEEKKAAKRTADIPARETLQSVLLRGVYSANPLREVAGDFFRNHFSVNIDKKNLRTVLPDWEREVIHQRALGNFGELLEATAKHPCMLMYLDNFLSRKPPTPQELERIEAAVRRRAGPDAPDRVTEALDLARQRGLNENYAREIMELHTLGVDNGYVQEDVVNVAKCLTGWTVANRREPAGFRFEARAHCPGDKTVLGQVIPDNAGRPIEEGEAVLRILKTHDGTARFISWKLCVWLVNDDPDPALVARVTEVFRATQGDIPSVLRAVVGDPSFFDRSNFRTKFKRPWEFVLSALRATEADVARGDGLLKALVAMNEPLYRCPNPTGYYDRAEAWRDPGCLAARWSFASDLAGGKIPGVRIPADLYRDLNPKDPRACVDALASRLLPGTGVAPATAERLVRLVHAELEARPRATPAQVGAILAAGILGSPDFQRQ